MKERLNVRNMTRDEAMELVHWAALEGWNPGLHDADIFWETGPEAFIAAEFGGEVIGGGTITSYGGLFGFMGLFIIKPEFRQQGMGNRLWHERRQRLSKRLAPNATMGMDGVFEMQGYYAKGGFTFSHRNIRFSTRFHESPNVSSSANSCLTSLSSIPFSQILDYDASCFPVARQKFLNLWIAQPDSRAFGYLENNQLKGYGLIRRCQQGCKIGPLFADNADVADALFCRLVEFAEGAPVFLDVPEYNHEALALVTRYHMEEVFGCARMYSGRFPDMNHDRVFGVTTFELG